MNLQDDIKLYMWDWVKQYTNDYCIERVPPDEPPMPGFTEGSFYTYQFYLRRGLFNRTYLTYCGMLFWDRFGEEFRRQPFQIAGLETASTPLIVGLLSTAAAYDIDVNAFSIRKERKTYGLLNVFEGIPDPNIPVLIVDDLANSGDSIKQAQNTCKTEGLPLSDTIFTIVRKQFAVTENLESKTTFDVVEKGKRFVSLFASNHFDLDYVSYHEKKKLPQAAE